MYCPGCDGEPDVRVPARALPRARARPRTPRPACGTAAGRGASRTAPGPTSSGTSGSRGDRRYSRIAVRRSSECRRCGPDCQRRASWLGSPPSPSTLTAKPSRTSASTGRRTSRTMCSTRSRRARLDRLDGLGAGWRPARSRPRSGLLGAHALGGLGGLAQLGLGLLLALGLALAGLGQRALGLVGDSPSGPA